MPQNEIWKLFAGRYRCHTEQPRLRTRLCRLSGAKQENEYYHHQRQFAWDVDVPIDKVQNAEKMLGVTRDDTTGCTAWIPVEQKCASEPRFQPVLRGVNPDKGTLHGFGMERYASNKVTQKIEPVVQEKGLEFQQERRSQKCALYSDWMEVTVGEGKAMRKEMRHFGYTVFIIAVTKDGREKIPDSEMWGERAWSFSTKETAEAAYEEFLELEKHG